MVPEGRVSELAEQLLDAKARGREAGREGKDTRATQSVVRSLRQTLGCMVQCRDLQEVAAKGFSLLVNASGEVQVRHGEWNLPVSSEYLLVLLAEAGVRLVPGQILLLDAVVVKLLVEEALGALRLGQAQIRDSKSRLIKASLEADALVKATRRIEERLSPEAA